jgi:regulator of replication initiation timing
VITEAEADAMRAKIEQQQFLAESLEDLLRLRAENATLHKQLQETTQKVTEQKSTIDQYEQKEATYQKFLQSGRYNL